MGHKISEKLKELQKLETERTKVCTCCDKIKPLTEFVLRADRRKFVASQCKKCQKRKNRNYDKLISKPTHFQRCSKRQIAVVEFIITHSNLLYFQSLKNERNFSVTVHGV